jgi:formate hydrogenlyase transcriptional activator
MSSARLESPDARWLVENGPRELELLFRAIVYHPSAPILIADGDGNSRDASVGVGKLLGLPRDKIIGRPVVDFAQPGFKPEISQLWRALQERGEQEGTLRLVGPDAKPRDVEYSAKGNVLPVRHVIVLREKTQTDDASAQSVPAWVQDYAWYSGAERIYGYRAEEAIGPAHVFSLSGYRRSQTGLQEELKRAAAEGHFGTKAGRSEKTGRDSGPMPSPWPSKTMKTGELQGFARVVRDFSDRHERDEKLRRSRARVRPIPAESTIAGIVSGEFDRIPEANDAFLELVGYSREDLLAAGCTGPISRRRNTSRSTSWRMKKVLRFGACTPFEKELIRKDGTRVPVW